MRYSRFSPRNTVFWRFTAFSTLFALQTPFLNRKSHRLLKVIGYWSLQILKAEIKLVWKVNISKLNSSNCRGENFCSITRKTLILTIYRVFYTLCFANTFFKSKIAQTSKSDGLLFYTDSESWDQTGLESELTSASSPLQFELLDFEMFLTLILPSSIERNLWLWNFQVFFSAFYIEYRKSSLNFVTFNAHFPNQLLISKLKCINTCIFFQTFWLSYLRLKIFHFTYTLTISMIVDC